jgi:hypothetical protein
MYVKTFILGILFFNLEVILLVHASLSWFWKFGAWVGVINQASRVGVPRPLSTFLILDENRTITNESMQVITKNHSPHIIRP